MTPAALALDTFDRFPSGILVCDREGRVVAVNRRARELMAHQSDDLPARCCDVVGCGQGSLEGSCVTALALADGEHLPDVRLDLPGTCHAQVRVTAAPLYEDRSHIVVELRPEPARCVPRLRIFALGALRVETEDGTLSGRWLEHRPGQLMRFLVCHRHHVAPPEVIAEAMWADPGPAAPATVRYLVHTLRGHLDPGRGTPALSPVVCRRGGYALDPDRVWIDADEFERESRGGLAALAAGDRNEARRRLEAAIAVYADDLLLDEPYAEWAILERERLRALACDALRALAELRSEEPEEAARHLERLSELEPFDDDVQRQLISAWLRMGRKSRAARHYHSFRLRLQREFGARPDFELSQLVCTGS